MDLELNKNKTPTTIFLVVLAVAAGSAILWAVISSFSLPLRSLFTIAIAVVVSAFVARFQLRLPRYPETLPVGNLFASMLELVGVFPEHVGDSTGRLNGLSLS